LQLARLVERVNRNFDEKRLTGAVFLDLAKALGTVWVKDLLYKLTIQSFPSNIVKTISCVDSNVAHVLPVSHTLTSCHAGWFVPLVSPVLFSLYVNNRQPS
jgi:hypothetical protein